MGYLYKGSKKIGKIAVKTRVNTEFITATASDIVSGKKSIDQDYNQITGTMVLDESLSVLTSDANALATDITAGKTAYVNGVKITGSADRVDSSDFISGNIVTYPVGDNNIIYVGNFVYIVNNSVVRATTNISGVAKQSGVSGETIEIIVPNI